MPAIRALFRHYFPKNIIFTQKGTSYATPKSPSVFASLSSKKDGERGVSVQLSSKTKNGDVDDFIPLVNLETVNGSHLELPSSSERRKSQIAFANGKGTNDD